MRKLIIGMIGMLLAVSVARADGNQFRVIETWKHDLEITGMISDSMVSMQGDVVTIFYKLGPVRISPLRAEVICHRGQGPDELQDLFASCEHPLGLAFVELPFRVKVFGRKGGRFHCRRTVWLERSPFYTVVSSALFSGGKWILAGYFLENFSRKYVYKKVFVRIYNEKGKYIKGLVRCTDHKPDQRHLMDYYLVEADDRILFLAEDRLRVTVISRASLEVLHAVDLTTPEGYRPIPKDYYVFKRYDDPYSGILKDIDVWRTGYSRILWAGFDKGRLVLQIRAFKPNTPAFQVLLYEGEAFKLTGVLATRDRLLGVRNGLYYFYANGDPRFDEDADRCVVKVCKLEKGLL